MISERNLLYTRNTWLLIVISASLPFGAVKIVLLGSDASSVSAVSDATGSYKFILKKDVNYQLNASKYRFFGDVEEATTYGLKESKDFELNFNLSPIPLKEIVVKGIYYDLASADLKPESVARLDSATKTLRDNPTFVIEIAAHTDSRADSNYNYELSQRRAIPPRVFARRRCEFPKFRRT